MVCSSGIGFDPLLDGERLTFGFEGIWQGTAVLYDRRTGSLWMHYTGACFEGPLKGRRLAPLATGRHTTWAAWRAVHPETDAMAPDPRFQGSYFRREQCRSGDAFLPRDFPSTIQSRDPRLKLSELLLGVRAGEAWRAYPLERLGRSGPVVNEALGGVPLSVWFLASERSAAAYDRRLGERTLTFALRDGRVTDAETGSTWSPEGEALEGPLQGQRLRRPEQLLTEWYGWFAHHPGTTIWEP